MTEHSSAGIEAALRDAFPHFQDDAPITPDAIRAIGREYHDMVMGWEPQKTEMEFADNNGNIHKIVYEAGDYEVGINPGWVLADDEPLNPAQHMPDPLNGGEYVSEDDPDVALVAHAIAERGCGRPWDDFLPTNAFDLDQGDLTEFARAAVAALRGKASSFASTSSGTEPITPAPEDRSNG